MIVALIIGVVLQVPVPTFVPLASPTPVATSAPVDLGGTLEVPQGDMYNYLATANANLESAPENLTNPGVAVLPNQNGSQLFAYAKWITSAGAADEVFGPFGPIVTHIGAAVILIIFLAIVYFIIFLVTLIIRFVGWLITKVTQVVPGLG